MYSTVTSSAPISALEKNPTEKVPIPSKATSLFLKQEKDSGFCTFLSFKVSGSDTCEQTGSKRAAVIRGAIDSVNQMPCVLCEPDVKLNNSNS